jgi:hypothetical protein
MEGMSAVFVGHAPHAGMRGYGTQRGPMTTAWTSFQDPDGSKISVVTANVLPVVNAHFGMRSMPYDYFTSKQRQVFVFLGNDLQVLVKMDFQEAFAVIPFPGLLRKLATGHLLAAQLLGGRLTDCHGHLIGVEAVLDDEGFAARHLGRAAGSAQQGRAACFPRICLARPWRRCGTSW